MSPEKYSTRDLFPDQPKKRGRGRPARELQKLDQTVIETVMSVLWLPHADDCAGPAGDHSALLGAQVERLRTATGTPVGARTVPCGEATRFAVGALRLMGVGQKGLSFGRGLDRAFANAVAWIDREAERVK